MRLAMLELNGRKGIAANDGERFHALFEGDAGFPGSLESLIRNGADLVATGKKLLQAPPLVMGGARFLTPVSKPEKIICIGLNYAAHSSEVGREVPKFPEIFLRLPTSLVAHNEPIAKPPFSDQLDYEGEVGMVIGKKGRNIPKEKALEYVAGFSIFNDGSVRDFQFRTSQWTMGKNFDATGGFGPWLVTPDELPAGASGLHIQTRLNGDVLQDANTSDMIFDIPEQIAYLSQAMTLEPGDVFVTGTPSGVGVSRNPQRFMKPGDICEIEVERIGILRNPIA